MPETKKSRRKKSKASRDSTYKPKRSSTSRKPASTEGLLRLMGVASSPSERVAVSHTFTSPPPFISNAKTPVLTPSSIDHSTPGKGPASSSVTTKTPRQTKLLPSRSIICDDGAATIFLSENKVTNSRLALLPPNKWVENSSKIPSVSLNGKIDFEISKATIERARKQIQDRCKAGGSARVKSQKTIMKIAARDALIKAGYKIKPYVANWIHFLPHEFFADEAQVPDNLGLGLKGANGAMELVNRALIDILFHPDETLRPEKLFLSAIPTWVDGYENIRLLDTLTYTVKNQEGASLSVTLDMLSFADVCISEVRLFQSFLEKKFLKKPALSLETTLLKSDTSDDDVEFLLDASQASPVLFSRSRSNSSASSSSVSPRAFTPDHHDRPLSRTARLTPKTLF